MPDLMHGDVDFLKGPGEMATLMRAFDWTKTPLGRPATWPQALQIMVSVMLNSPLLGCVLWGPDLLLIYNDAYAPALQERHPAALGRPLREVWADIWADLSGPFIGVYRTGQAVSQERLPLRMLRNGRREQTYWNYSVSPIFDSNGQVGGVFNNAIDITAQVHAEELRAAAEADLQALNASLQQQVDERTASLRLYRNIVESDSAPVLAFDHDYKAIGFNRAQREAFVQVMGREHRIGDVLPDLIPPDQALVLRGFMDRALAGEVFEIVEEFGAVGQYQSTWQIAYAPVYDNDSKIVGAFQHARDVTLRVRAEAELTQLQEQLRQSQKMEAVGQLTGGLAHDFNNLLAVVTGSLELLERRIAQGRTSEVARFVSAAQTAAKRATTLTQRLLAFSRRQTLTPKPTGVNQLIAGMDDMIRRTVGPQIAVEMVGAAGLWTTLVDPNQLENALLNLCINARDAMPDGGRLTIETANKWLDDRAAKARDLPPGQYVSLCVSDTGCGMPPDVIAKAFDPFFTTKPLGQGTGLGLSMIYGFARQSGGQVRIYSEAGQGAMVCLYLPRHHGNAVDGDELAFATPEEAKQGETVLIVDDEPGVRMLVAEVLEDLGYHVLEAEAGPAALKIVASQARIDLLVTDVGLPGGMNGRQVADAARVARSGLKVLFITGYAENAVLGHGHLDPGMSVITKPFAVDDLANRIKDLISAAPLPGWRAT